MSRIQTWVSTLINSSSSTRRKLKQKVTEGISFFNSKWNDVPPNEDLSDQNIPPKFKLKSKDKDVENFVKSLKKEKNLKFIGFIPEVTYVKESGPKEHLEVLWEHQFGSPALLYAHESLPMLIITGPNIMFNDSIIRSIKTNSYKEKVNGVTG